MRAGPRSYCPAQYLDRYVRRHDGPHLAVRESGFPGVVGETRAKEDSESRLMIPARVQLHLLTPCRLEERRHEVAPGPESRSLFATASEYFFGDPDFRWSLERPSRCSSSSLLVPHWTTGLLDISLDERVNRRSRVGYHWPNEPHERASKPRIIRTIWLVHLRVHIWMVLDLDDF